MPDPKPEDCDKKEIDADDEADREHAALFWAAFARGCGDKPIARACVAKAVELECYRWACLNREAFKKGHEKDASDEAKRFLRNTFACCLRAGRIASFLASEFDRDEVSDVDFEMAFNIVKSSMLALARANHGVEPGSFVGGLCSGG